MIYGKDKEFVLTKVIGLVEEISSEIGIDITEKTRKRVVFVPRSVAMFLMRDELHMSLVDIGIVFEKNHATIINAVKGVENSFQQKDAVSEQVKEYYDFMKNKFITFYTSMMYVRENEEKVFETVTNIQVEVNELKSKLEESRKSFVAVASESQKYKSAAEEQSMRASRWAEKYHDLKSTYNITSTEDKEVERMKSYI
jgi:FtsZ-binding cell division protein ZapB